MMRGTVIRCDKNLFVSVDFDFGNPIVPVSTCHNPMRTTGRMMPAEEDTNVNTCPDQGRT